MRVTITSCTHDPLRAISVAAGTCYGKSNHSEKRIRTCFNAGHMSVFEQASIQFYIEGISRSCSHQLVRHRLNSYCQQSQRYCRIDTDSDDWYVMPEAFASDPDWRAWYERQMHTVAQRYTLALKGGMKPEDARFILPEACKTSIMVTMNVRNLYHFLDMRLDSHAQWEIRELAQKMRDACMENEELKPLMELYVEKRKARDHEEDDTDDRR